MTDIKKTPIPQRLKNVSNDHPYVAGAIDIIDDATGENQQEINADTYRKDETYSKEQLNSMITTPEQKYENYTAEDGDTFSDLGLPAEGEADTTYRVGSWDGTEYNASKFSEYSWDGTQYILLSVQSPGIDDEPTAGSQKLVESGGVFSFVDELNAPLDKTKESISLTGSVSGKYINKYGEIEDLDGPTYVGHYSNPILLQIGDTIEIVAKSSLYVGAVCKTDEAASSYTVLKTGVGEASIVPMQTVVYTAEEDGYYAFSWVDSGEITKIRLTRIANIETDNYSTRTSLRKGVPVFDSVGQDTTLDNIAEVFIYDKYFGDYTNYVSVLCYQHRLYLVGQKESNTVYPTWWAKTSVLTGGENGKVYPIVFTDEGGTPAEAEENDIIGYVVFSDIDTFEGTSVTSGYHPLNLKFISNIRLCPKIASSMNEYLEKTIANVNTISNVLGISVDLVDVTIALSNKCIRETGEVVDLSSCSISEPIYFHKNDNIHFTARSSAYIGTICKTDSTGSSYTPVGIGYGAGSVIPMQTVVYRVVEDGYYAFSWYDSYKLCELSENNTDTYQRFNLLAMYDNITYCGDSLTYSQVSTSQSEYRQAKKTYPAIVSSICGNTPTVLARPGDTPKKWWERYSSQLVEKSNNLYIIYLGTNQGLTDTIDEDCPEEGSIEDYADTNTGYYGRILKTIHELGDKAVLVKISEKFTYTEVTNSVIEEFGERFNFPVVKNDRINDLIYRYYPDMSGYDTVHLNDIGYSYFANRLIRDIAEMPYAMYERLVATEEQ